MKALVGAGDTLLVACRTAFAEMHMRIPIEKGILVDRTSAAARPQKGAV